MTDRTGRGVQARRWMTGLDRRYLPPAAAALDGLVTRTSRRRSSDHAAGGLQIAPDARRVLGALAVVLLLSAVALLVIGA